MLLLITGKSGKCFHSANIISNVGNSGDRLQKNSKSNKTRIFAKICQGIMDSLPRFRAGAGLLLLKNCLFEIPQISLTI